MNWMKLACAGGIGVVIACGSPVTVVKRVPANGVDEPPSENDDAPAEPSHAASTGSSSSSSSSGSANSSSSGGGGGGGTSSSSSSSSSSGGATGDGGPAGDAGGGGGTPCAGASEHEPNDAEAEANALVDRVCGALPTTSDVDWFRFSAAANEQVSIAFDGADAAELTLYAPGDSVSSMVGPGTSSVTTSSAGTYEVRVRSPYTAPQTYTVTLTRN